SFRCRPCRVTVYVASMLSFLVLPQPPSSSRFPYTTLFRSTLIMLGIEEVEVFAAARVGVIVTGDELRTHAEATGPTITPTRAARSEEHTSELQSRFDLVCRLLLEKKNENTA